jgi:hypothetical protein
MAEQATRGLLSLALLAAGAGALLPAGEKPHPLAAPRVTNKPVRRPSEGR